MTIPWFSTFTLFTEILVTSSILYSFYSAMHKNRFPYVLVFITLSYEVLFNISYMASRAVSGKNPSQLESPTVIGLAIFHGVFSLVMFVSLLVFMIMAWRKYKKGINFFSNHRTLTYSFVFFWLVAVFSGIFFYFLTYF
jgi:hypothetical protein